MAFPGDYAKRCELTLAQVGENLTDFTLSLNENGLPAEIFSIASDGGGELRFSSDIDGTNEIPRDVRHFSTGGTADIAVKVPSLSSTGTTPIWVWYDSSDLDYSPGDPNGQYAAYDSNHLAVWPLHEDPTANAADAMKDRTSAGEHLTPVNMTGANVPVPGVLYNAATFTAAGEYMSRTGLSFSLTNATITMLLYPRLRDEFRYLIDMYWDQGGRIALGTTDFFGTFRSAASPYGSAVTNPAVNEWKHLATIRTGSTDITVLDDEVGPDYTGGTPSSITSFSIGENRTNEIGSYKYDGIIEEIRLSDTNRSIAWVTAEYQNKLNMGTFVTVGTPELPSGDHIVTTVTATNAAGSDAESFKWSEIPPP